MIDTNRSPFRSDRVLLGLMTLLLLMALGRAVAAEQHPLEPLDTSNPRATLFGFLETVDVLAPIGKDGLWQESTNYEEHLRRRTQVARALSALDLSEIPPASRHQVGVAAGVYLYEVLSRLELPASAEIPDAEPLEADEEPPDHYRIPKTEISLTRVAKGERAGEFLFSPETVSRAQEFFERVENLPYRRAVPIPNMVDFLANKPGWIIPVGWLQHLPDWAKRPMLEHGLWKWIGLVILGLVVLALLALLNRFIARWRSESQLGNYLRRLALPISVIILMPIVVDLANIHLLDISGQLAQAIALASWVITYLAAAWAAWLLPMVVAEKAISSPNIPSEGLDANLMRLVARLVGIALAVLIVLYGANQVGVPLLGVVAGLGVGGLAIALAAQDTLKNLLGSIMIYTDRPYRIGDRIVVKGHDGVVEEIGLRSTKIRLLNGPVTSIPNERMATEDIANISRRPFIQRIFNVQISFDNPPEKVARALELLREILSVSSSEDEIVVGDEAMGGSESEPSDVDASEQNGHRNAAINQGDLTPRVYLDELKDDALNFLIIYWHQPPDYWDYLEHATWVNQQIVERFNAEGIEFAYPARRVYLRREMEPNPSNPTSDNFRPSDRFASVEN